MTTKFKHDHWTKGVTERVNHLRDTFWKFEPSVDIERSVIYTRTYKETEAEDTIIRRATSFKNYMNERTIDILPGELIVGTSGKAPKSFIFCPDVCFGWVEAELEEIVKMVGMDALSPIDRLKMEAARSIREDFLHQNSFHEIDTYTPLQKQFRMMKLVLAFYEQSKKALEGGASIQNLIKMPVREQIGRFKYTKAEDVEKEYQAVLDELAKEVADAAGKGAF